MKEFYHKHKRAILITVSLIAVYLLYLWYKARQASNAANQNAADQQAAQDAYLSSLYGAPLLMGGGSVSPGGGIASPGSSGLLNVVPTPGTPADTTTTDSTGAAAGAAGPSGITTPGTIGPPAPQPTPTFTSTPATPAQLNAAGGSFAFPTGTSAQDFANEHYTGNFEQDAAMARQLSGEGTSESTSLFLGAPAFLAAGGTQAPPELVAACNADQAAGRICGQPGTQTDIVSYQMGLPTQGNYETGPNNSVVEIPAGTTPIGLTPEEIANQNSSVYVAANGVTFVNGVPMTGAQLPAPPPAGSAPAGSGTRSGGSQPKTPVNTPAPPPAGSAPAGSGTRSGGSQPNPASQTPSSSPVQTQPTTLLSRILSRNPSPGLPVITPPDQLVSSM